MTGPLAELNAEILRLREELALRDDSLANRRVRELQAEVERLSKHIEGQSESYQAGYEDGRAEMREEVLAAASRLPERHIAGSHAAVVLASVRPFFALEFPAREALEAGER